MLNADDFLRNMPQVVQGRSRLAIDAILFAADSAGFSYDEMSAVATQIGPGSMPTENHRLLLLRNAWSIVDQIYAVRQLLKTVSREGLDKLIDGWRAFSRPAGDLRNKFDHLDSNLGNLAAKADFNHPLLGVVGTSFIELLPHGTIQLYGATVAAGVQPGETTWVMGGITIGEEIPGLSVDLSAFEIKLDLGKQIEALSEMLQHLSTMLYAEFLDQIAALPPDEQAAAQVPWKGAEASVGTMTITPANAGDAHLVQSSVTFSR